MSYTKRKLMGLLTLGTATLGTVSSGVTSAGSSFFSSVKNFFNPTTQTKETKKKSERIIDASRGYGAAINLANIICSYNQKGVIDLLEKELNIFSESKGQENLSKDQLSKTGNALLKIAYDLGIGSEDIKEILKSAEGYSELNGINFVQSNSENTLNLYDEDSRIALAKSLTSKKGSKENKGKKTDINVFNLFLLSSKKLASNLEDKEENFVLNINYHAVDNKKNIDAVKAALPGLIKKIFETLQKASNETLKNGISSIMQVICEQKGSNYFRDLIEKLMNVEVTDESNQENVNYKKSSQFKKLIETIEKKEGNLKDKDLPKDTQDGNNKIEVVKEMIKFSDKDGVLFEVLDSLGYTRGAVGRFFDNKYVRVALGAGAAVGIAYVAGIPLLSVGFAKVAAGCLVATKLLDLRHQDFGTWAWSNIKSAATTTATIVKGVGSIIGKGMSLFEGYKW